MMSHRRKWFTTFTPFPKPISIILGNDSAIAATGTGNISTLTFDSTCWAPALLQDILYVPSLHGNLLSALHMAHCGYELCFANDECHIFDNAGGTACTGHLCGNLYLMDIQTAGSKKIHTTHSDPPPQDNDNVEYALTVHTNMRKMTLAAQHKCLGHPHTDKNDITLDDQGGTTMAHASEEHALTAPLLITSTPSITALRAPTHPTTTHTSIGTHKGGPSLAPLAARGCVRHAQATRLQRQCPGVVLWQLKLVTFRKQT